MVGQGEGQKEQNRYIHHTCKQERCEADGILYLHIKTTIIKLQCLLFNQV